MHWPIVQNARQGFLGKEGQFERNIGTVSLCELQIVQSPPVTPVAVLSWVMLYGAQHWVSSLQCSSRGVVHF